MQKDIAKIADHFGIHEQRDKAIEELEELVQAIKNIKKGTTSLDYAKLYENLVEEIADAEIMIEQLKLLHEIDESDVDFVKEEKIKRTIDRYKIDRRNENETTSDRK